MAEKNGDDNDPCWVVKIEKENRKNNRGFFKAIGNIHLIGVAHDNIDLTNPEKCIVYSGCNIPITIDKLSYNTYNRELNCPHHPFLCELNRACKGDHPLLSHCCIRPSHLCCI